MFKTTVAVILILFINVAWSHSFKLVIILPQSGPQAESGQQVLDGFLLATTEEDSHPDETSDGHLGGLDSHVLKIDSGAGSIAVLEGLAELMKYHEPIFVTGLFSADTAAQVMRLLKGGTAVLFDPVESSMWQNAISLPNSLESMTTDLFAAKFQNRYSYAPTPDAIRGYIAARLIAATVRQSSESELDDSELLASRLNRLQKN